MTSLLSSTSWNTLGRQVPTRFVSLTKHAGGKPEPNIELKSIAAFDALDSVVFALEVVHAAA